MSAHHQVRRPRLDTDGTSSDEAKEAVARLVEELQSGIDHHDAEVYNRHFADDVMWGSPFGATVNGYEQLHAIHARLLGQGTGGPSSRYEVDHVQSPAPDVAVAHVRRVSLDAEGRPLEPTSDPTGPFSEMALYVLIRRGDRWWLAAGQNTPIRPGGALDPSRLK
jgi:uncharacterized protein (TIGR02246 family)